MSESTITQFSIVSNPLVSLDFDDQKLGRIATRLNQPIEKITDEIAQHLLCNFSLNYGNSAIGKSDRLKKIYLEYLELYNAVIETSKGEGEILKIPQLQAHFQHESAYTPLLKTRMASQLKLKALMSHDVIRSFPKRCECPELETPSLAHKLFAVLDGNEQFVPSELAPFFFKHIALYINPKTFLTWHDLGVEWARNSNIREKFLKFKRSLPLYWLAESPIKNINQIKDSCFKEYTHLQTIECFKGLLKVEIGFPQFTRLKEEMQDETFRLDMVFYTGNPSLLIHPNFKCEKKIRPWLITARRLLHLNNNYQYQSDEGARLFRWIFKTLEGEDVVKRFDEFGHLEEPKKIRPITGYISEAVKLMNLFFNFEQFDPFAFTILLIMIDFDLNYIKQIIEKIRTDSKDEFLKDPIKTFKDAILTLRKKK